MVEEEGGVEGTSERGWGEECVSRGTRGEAWQSEGMGEEKEGMERV
jgi:hypothetical protein